MRTGRPTVDKKDNTVRVRVNDDTYEFLQEVALANNISVSDVVRHCISLYMREIKMRE